VLKRYDSCEMVRDCVVGVNLGRMAEGDATETMAGGTAAAEALSFPPTAPCPDNSLEMPRGGVPVNRE